MRPHHLRRVCGHTARQAALVGVKVVQSPPPTMLRAAERIKKPRLTVAPPTHKVVTEAQTNQPRFTTTTPKSSEILTFSTKPHSFTSKKFAQYRLNEVIKTQESRKRRKFSCGVIISQCPFFCQHFCFLNVFCEQRFGGWAQFPTNNQQAHKQQLCCCCRDLERGERFRCRRTCASGQQRMTSETNEFRGSPETGTQPRHDLSLSRQPALSGALPGSTERETPIHSPLLRI